MLLAALSVFAMALHVILNRALFDNPRPYLRLIGDALLSLIAVLWLLNLLVGLQGMS